SPAAHRLELLAGELERHAQLDERLHLAKPRFDAGRGALDAFGTAEADAGEVPAARAVEVDELARREHVLEGALCLLLDLGPGLRRDGRKGAKKVVHRFSLRRSPMPSEPPSPAPSSGAPSAASAASRDSSTSSTGFSVKR